MAEYKNQHIVPQHYLRGFSNDKETLYRYNIKTGKVSHKSIKKIANEGVNVKKYGLLGVGPFNSSERCSP